MKRFLLLGIFSVCISMLAGAQNYVLWEISGNGLTKTSYLMGTLKFIGEKEYYLPAESVDRLKTSTLFAIEDQVDHHAQHELNKNLHFPKGQSLATALSPEDYKKLKEFFAAEFGIPEKAFVKQYNHVKPLALSIVMTRLSLGEDVRYYDIELLEVANKNNVTAYSLESIDRESEALNKFSIEEQSKALMHSVANFKAQKEEFQKLMKDFPDGDLDEIFTYTLHPFENNPVFVEEFYTKRNEEWLPKIEKMIHEETAFITVGVSHLEGEKGLPALLKAKGYTLTPVSIKRRN
jgi:uncharacterized protein YbaP (TraB family)